MLYSILRFLAILIFKILFRVEAKGVENIPKKGGFILAGNHASYLDPLVLGISSPRKLNYMAREDLFDNPLFAWLLCHVGVFPVKRDSPDLSALKEAMRQVKNGNGLVLFPEGTRSVNGVIKEPHAGIGFLVSKLAVPVIPAFVKGTELAWPKGAKFIRPKKIFVYFGKEISLERRQHYQDIARRIMQEVRLLS